MPWIYINNLLHEFISLYIFVYDIIRLYVIRVIANIRYARVIALTQFGFIYLWVKPFFSTHYKID